MRPVQCARCGASFFATPDGTAACPSCGLPFAYGAPSSSWPGAPASRPPPPDTRSRPLAGGYPGDHPSGYGPPDNIPPEYRPGGQTHAWGAPVGPYDTADMGPQYQYQHPYDPEPDRETSDRGCRLASVVGVALVVVIALGLVGIVYFGGPLNKTVTIPPTATPTFGPTPTATLAPIPSGFTRYTDPNHQFTLGVPSEWTDVSGLATATDALPSGTHFVIFLDEAQDALLEVIDTPEDASAIDGVETAALRSNSNYAITVSNQSGPDTVTVAGASWTQRAADQTAPDIGLTLHLVVIGTTRNHHDIFIVYGALKSAFDNLDETMFQKSLDTFAFTQ